MPELNAPVLPHDEERLTVEEAEAARAGGIIYESATNYIGLLNELVKQKNFPTPTYEETEAGPSHLRTFTCKVKILDFTEIGKPRYGRSLYIFFLFCCIFWCIAS